MELFFLCVKQNYLKMSSLLILLLLLFALFVCLHHPSSRLPVATEKEKKVDGKLLDVFY